MSGGECAARGPLLGMGSPRDRQCSAGALAIEARLIGPDRVVGTMCRPVDVNAPFYQPLVAGLVDGQGLAQRRSVERQLDLDVRGTSRGDLRPVCPRHAGHRRRRTLGRPVSHANAALTPRHRRTRPARRTRPPRRHAPRRCEEARQHPRRRNDSHRHRSAGPDNRLVHRPRGRRRTDPLRQRWRLPLTPVARHQRRAGDPTPAPLPVSAPDQRKVERFHRTQADGWAYARCYTSEAERHGELDGWLHCRTQHRPHAACGNRPPFSRLINVPDQDI